LWYTVTPMPMINITLPPSCTNNIPLLNIKVNNTTNFHAWL
jgi:hypothetical protein